MSEYNITMNRVLLFIFILFALLWEIHGDEITLIGDLNHEDTNFTSLYNSTIASKNRMIKKTRLEEYNPPKFYRYTLKRGEDIWTLIAKTSLNIDTLATLNRFDFIGVLGEGTEVFLSDTLGIFYEKDKIESLDRIIPEGMEILSQGDPLNPGNNLYFIPEWELAFLERTYLTGVVFHSPLMGVETSKYGIRNDPFINKQTFHGGIDIASEEGKLVHASRWGKVIYTGMSNGYGNLVILLHELGYYTLYGHLKEILVNVDDNVDTGQVIGKVGITGRTTGPHLHFEIRRNGEKLNPDNIPFFINHG